MEEQLTLEWLMNLPAVQRREIVVDVRAPYPVLIRGINAQTVRTRMDVVNFFIYNLD
jgi:hypothetical protein